MSELSDTLTEGLGELEVVTGHQAFIYRGKTSPGVAGRLQRGIDLGIGPPTLQLTRTLTVRKNAMPILTVDSSSIPADQTADSDLLPPHPGKTIQYENRIYEVLSVDEDGTGAAWIIHMLNPNS